MVFSQDTPHEGVPVGAGREKEIIRTDVMYRRVPPVFDDAVGKDLHSSSFRLNLSSSVHLITQLDS